MNDRNQETFQAHERGWEKGYVEGARWQLAQQIASASYINGALCGHLFVLMAFVLLIVYGHGAADQTARIAGFICCAAAEGLANLAEPRPAGGTRSTLRVACVIVSVAAWVAAISVL